MATWTLITGATGGLGRAFALQLAEQGENLVLTGRKYDEVYKLAAQLYDEYSVQTYAIAKDLSQPGAVDELVAELEQAGIEVETLVNNAGFGCNSAFLESDLAHQTALLQVNCLAYMQLCYQLAIPMVERGHGGILNVASIAGYMPGPYMATYYASKAFARSFSETLHVELAEYGIRVTTLCPGPVKTPFWERADAQELFASKEALSASADFVAREGLRAFKRNKAVCIPGAVAKATVFASRVLPSSAMARMAAAMQRK